MREKRFTLSRSQREEMWRRFKQADDLALTLPYTNSTSAEDPLSEQRIGRLRRLVDAYDRGLDTPLRSVERAALPLALARQPLWWVGAGLRCWMTRSWRGGASRRWPGIWSRRCSSSAKQTAGRQPSHEAP